MVNDLYYNFSRASGVNDLDYNYSRPQAPWKCHAAGPLDEHKKVVSERILSAVVRETCLNIRVSVLLEQDPKLR